MLLRIVLLAGLVACGGPHTEAPDAMPCEVGDVAQAPEMQVIYRTTAGEAAPLADGATLPLTVPPQGGHILLVGVRVKNVDLCNATIQVALKDPNTARVAGIERRPVAWHIADDGFAEPAQPFEISDYANVPVCPNANLAQNIYDAPWTLEVRFYDAEENPTEQVLTVTPTCDEDLDPQYCRCECAMDPEVACAPDAGV